jgi:hypothetical protein
MEQKGPKNSGNKKWRPSAHQCHRHGLPAQRRVFRLWIRPYWMLSTIRRKPNKPPLAERYFDKRSSTACLKISLTDRLKKCKIFGRIFYELKEAFEIAYISCRKASLQEGDRTTKGSPHRLTPDRLYPDEVTRNTDFSVPSQKN